MRYLKDIEVKKIISRKLKEKYPHIKFNIRRYNGLYNCGYLINYNDDFIENNKEKIKLILEIMNFVDEYAGSYFISDLDMHFERYFYLLPDGTALFSHDSRGRRDQPVKYENLPEGSELVQTMVTFGVNLY